MINKQSNTALYAYSKPRNIFESVALRLLKNISGLFKVSIAYRIESDYETKTNKIIRK
jgi:hypothetical protein